MANTCSAICAAVVEVNRIRRQWCEYQSLVDRLYNLRQTHSPAALINKTDRKVDGNIDGEIDRQRTTAGKLSCVAITNIELF